jgi:hypothetical protein
MERLDSAHSKFEKAIGHTVDREEFFKVFKHELKKELKRQIKDDALFEEINITFSTIHNRFVNWYNSNEWNKPSFSNLLKLLVTFTYTKVFIVLLRIKHEEGFRLVEPKDVKYK